MFDFVGNSGRLQVQQVTALEALEGKVGGAVLERARELAEQRGGGRPDEVMEEARAEILEEVTREARRLFQPRAVFTEEFVDPFGLAPAPAMAPRSIDTPRGGATDKQVEFLVKLGVQRETALAYGQRQASAVINNLRAKRCTTGQANALRRHGIDPEGISVDAAARMLDEILGDQRKAATR